MAGVYFNGKQILIPGAYSKIDGSGMTPISGAGGKVLALFGVSEGGVPQSIQWFNDPQKARQVLKSGELLQGAQIAWSPSATLNGADTIALVRVNAGTLATHTLSSTTIDAITLRARNYDLRTYTVKVVNGAGGFVVTLSDGVTTEVSPALGSTNGAVVDWINAYSSLVSAVKIVDTVISEVAIAEAFDTAGTSAVATPTDWQNACDLFGTFGTNSMLAMVPITPDATIQAYFHAHILNKSTKNKERRGFYGHALAEEISAVKTRATAFNSSRACLATPGIKRADSGSLVTLSSVFTACALAGMWAGSPDDEPLTFDYLNCLGLEKVYDDLEIGELLTAGIIPIEQDDVGYRVVQGVTTYKIDDSSLNTELSVATTADRMSVELRKHLERKFVGQRPALVTTTNVENATISKLNTFEKDFGWIIGDLVNGIPAYKNIRVTKENRVFTVEWEGAIGEPANFFLITSHFVPAN